MDDRTLHRYANSPAEFRNELLVDVDGIPRPFGTVIDDWQEHDFHALDDGLKIAAGRLHPSTILQETEDGERIFQRAYIERPRGHSKTTDLAVICTWAMAFASRPLKGFCFAADKEQAALLKEAIHTLVRLNPWLGEMLSVQKDSVVNIMEGHPAQGARLDLGLTRDCSAAVVLAIPEGGKAGRIRLAHTKLWRPVLGKKIDLTAVENYIVDLDRQFNLEFVGFDPWQAESMAQRLEVLSARRRRKRQGGSSRELEKRGAGAAWMQPMAPSGANLRTIASLTLEYFNDRRLELYPEDNLKRDLEKLRVEEKSYGYRLTSPRDELGHGDTFSAFAIALKLAHELAGKKTIIAGAISLNGRSNRELDVNKMIADALKYKEDREAEMNKPHDYNRSGNEEWKMLMRQFGRA